jgi:3D (Asp-Asp-Asp) domain-containing protein
VNPLARVATFVLAGGVAAFSLAGLFANPERLPEVNMHRHAIHEPPRDEEIRVEVFEVTAYCPCPVCCGQWADGGITASGSLARSRVTVAADLRVLPFGTRLYLPGVGDVEVEDTGSAIVGRRLDLFHASHSDALEWGRQMVAAVRLDNRPGV